MFTLQPLTLPMLELYQRFAFPWQRTSLAEDCQEEKVVAVAASYQGKPAGLVVARANPDKEKGIIHSLFVTSSFRNNGLGAKLLKAAEEGLQRRGCLKLTLTYRGGQRETPALLKVLQRGGWGTAAKIEEINKYTDAAYFLSWINRVAFQRGDHAIPWQALSRQQLAEIKQGEGGWYPHWVSPFKEYLEEVHPTTSFWLSCRGEIKGWLITMLVQEDTLYYQRLYVHEELQKTGRAMPLLAEAIKAQMREGIPFGSCLVAYGSHANPALLRFFEKDLKPRAFISAEYFQVEKQL